MYKRRFIAQKPEYIYDPDHKQKPAGGYHKTEQGWSLKDTNKKIDLTNKEINENNRDSFQKIYQKQITAQDVFTYYDEKGNKTTKKFGQLNDQQRKEVLSQISTCDLIHTQGFSDYSKVDKKTFQRNMDKVLSFIQDKDIELRHNQKETPIYRNVDGFIQTQKQNLQRAIAKYSIGVRSKFAQKALQNYKQKILDVVKQACTKQGGLGNVSEKQMDSFLQEQIKRLVYQQIETRRRSMGDHGIRHLVGNALNGVDIMQQLNKGGIPISGKDKLLVMSTMVNHDIGYTLGQVALDASKGGFHKSYSGIIALEEKQRYEKIFGKDGMTKMVGVPKTYQNGKPVLKRETNMVRNGKQIYQTGNKLPNGQDQLTDDIEKAKKDNKGNPKKAKQWKQYSQEQVYDENGNLKLTEQQYQDCKIQHEKGKQGVIQYHDSSNYDWKNDPIGSSVSLSDCTALFGKDKVQQFFYKNDVAMEQVTKLQCLLLSDMDDTIKQKSFQNFKKKMKTHIANLTDATPLDKDLLESQIEEMTIGKFSTIDDILTRSSGVLQQNPFSYDREKNQVIVETTYSEQGNLLDNIFGSEKIRNQWAKLYKDIQGSGKIVSDENGNQFLFKGDPDKEESRVLIKINGFTGGQFRNNGVANVYRQIKSFPIRKQLARLSQMFSLNKEDGFIKRRIFDITRRLEEFVQQSLSGKQRLKNKKEQKEQTTKKTKGQVVFGSKWEIVKQLLSKIKEGIDVSQKLKNLGFSDEQKSYLSSFFKSSSVHKYNKMAMKIAKEEYVNIMAYKIASDMSKRYQMKFGRIKFIYESYGQLRILFDGHLYQILNSLQMQEVQKFINKNKRFFVGLKDCEELEQFLSKYRLKYRRKF